MLLVGFVHTLAVDTPLPFPAAGAVSPWEVFGLAHQQTARGTRAPQGGARAGCIRAVLGFLSKCKLALPVGIIQSTREIRWELDGILRLVHQAFPYEENANQH